MNKKQPTTLFEQTAKDYDLPLETIKKVYKQTTNLIEFYAALENLVAEK